jgi:hypothetical protein
MVINIILYGMKLKLSALLKGMGEEGEYYKSKLLSTNQCIPVSQESSVDKRPGGITRGDERKPAVL